MKFEVTILGSSSATPIFNRNPTSQIVNINDQYLIIDCGEGTQQQMIKFGIKYQKVDYIFISHLHGDHYLGLIGLLSTMNLNGRSKALEVFAPEGLKEIMDHHFKYSQTSLKYPINFHETNASIATEILNHRQFSVSTIILNHRIPCTGFLIRQKETLPKIRKDQLELYQIPKEYIPLIKKGQDYVTPSGKVISSKDLTSPADKPKSYAYCSDTFCDWSYIDVIKDADLLYHESTFMHDMADRAADTYHTTALQAAEVADKAGAKKLLIGHFSARYKDLDPLLKEAKSVFSNTELAIEGRTFVV